MVNGEALADFDIVTETSLFLSVISPFQIFVKSLSGKTMTLQVQANNTVKQVKEKIRVKEGKHTYHDREHTVTSLWYIVGFYEGIDGKD